MFECPGNENGLNYGFPFAGPEQRTIGILYESSKVTFSRSSGPYKQGASHVGFHRDRLSWGAYTASGLLQMGDHL